MKHLHLLQPLLNFLHLLKNLSIHFDPKSNLKTIVSPLKFLDSSKITSHLMITY
jgi:hypothetical protein